MFTTIFEHEDDERPMHVIALEDGSAYVNAPERVSELTLVGLHRLRDALTDHLSGYPEPEPAPVAA